MATLTETPKQQSFVCNPPESEKARGAGFHTMHYLEWGDEHSEKVAVCVHSMTRNAHDFDFLACELVKQGYRVICPDIVGRGDSDWLTFSSLYGYPQYVADVMALLGQICEHNVDWIGTSMGGLIGMMVEASAPHLIHKMVLNDIGPFIPKSSLMRIGSYIGQHMVFDSWDAAETDFRENHKTFGVTEEYQWKHLIKHSFIEKENGEVHYKYDPAIGDAFWNKRGKQRRMPDMRLWGMWKTLHAPTLVLRGAESDLLLKKTADKMAQSDHVDLVEFDGCGHAPMLMDDVQISAVTQWLASGS